MVTINVENEETFDSVFPSAVTAVRRMPVRDRGRAAPDGSGAGTLSRLVCADAWWRHPIGQGQIHRGDLIEVFPIASALDSRLPGPAHDRRVKVLVSLGGNLAFAAPDTPYTFEAFGNCDLTVHVATKLNRSHIDLVDITSFSRDGTTRAV